MVRNARTTRTAGVRNYTVRIDPCPFAEFVFSSMLG
jgi:hypothetical protein